MKPLVCFSKALWTHTLCGLPNIIRSTHILWGSALSIVFQFISPAKSEDTHCIVHLQTHLLTLWTCLLTQLLIESPNHQQTCYQLHVQGFHYKDKTVVIKWKFISHMFWISLSSDRISFHRAHRFSAMLQIYIYSSNRNHFRYGLSEWEERRRYVVTSSLIGWAHIQNNSCSKTNHHMNVCLWK